MTPKEIEEKLDKIKELINKLSDLSSKIQTNSLSITEMPNPNSVDGIMIYNIIESLNIMIAEYERLSDGSSTNEERKNRYDANKQILEKVRNVLLGTPFYQGPVSINNNLPAKITISDREEYLKTIKNLLQIILNIFKPYREDLDSLKDILVRKEENTDNNSIVGQYNEGIRQSIDEVDDIWDIFENEYRLSDIEDLISELDEALENESMNHNQ